MGIKAKKDFTDRETGKEYKKGDPIKVSKEREKQILNSPYDVAEEVKEKEEENNVQAKSNKKPESKS